LVAECEAFLSGHFAQHLDEDRHSLPDWVWLNVLAHGGEDEIAALAAGKPRRRNSREHSVWQQALAFLAQEVMNQATKRGCTLADLQRSTLVPLEFELAGRNPRSYMEPAQFVGTVLSALAQHRISWCL